MRMAAEVCGLSARRAVCLLVSLYSCRVPCLVALSFPFMGCSIGSAPLPSPDVVGMSSRGRAYHAVRHPVLPDCLRLSAASWLKRRGLGTTSSPSFLLSAICVSPRLSFCSRPALLPVASCRETGRND